MIHPALPASSHFTKCNQSLRAAKENIPPDRGPPPPPPLWTPPRALPCTCAAASIYLFIFHLCGGSRGRGSEGTHASMAPLVEAGMRCPVKALRAGAVKSRPIAVVKLYGFLFCSLPASDIADDELSLRSATSQHNPPELFKKTKI